MMVAQMHVMIHSAPLKYQVLDHMTMKNNKEKMYVKEVHPFKHWYTMKESMM